MKKILLSLMACLPLLVLAQTDPKYLAGAISYNDDGKVSFQTEILTPSLTKQQLYDTLLKWANERFQPEGKMNARVLYTNEDEGTIAAGGEEYLVFSSSALSLDRTRIYYQLYLDCAEGKCEVEMTRIRYWYDEARDGGLRYSAEEWINDEMALNKKQTKLAPICGKFRRETIDLKDELFKDIQDVLGGLALSGTQLAATPSETASPRLSEPTITTVARPAISVGATTITSAGAATLSTATATDAATATAETATDAATAAGATIDDRIQASSRMTVAAGDEAPMEIGKECWGGFGQLLGKEVATCIIDSDKRLSNLLFDQSETYVIAFFLPNTEKPWLTLSCKKLMKQEVSGEEAQRINPDNDAQKAYLMYVGEVVKRSEE